MALATVDDLKRILRMDPLDTSSDLELQQAIDAAEGWFTRRARVRFQPGPQSITRYNVPMDGEIFVPDLNPVITAVTASFGDELSSTASYVFNAPNKVRLRSYYGDVYGSLRIRQHYSSVTVAYTASGEVPADLKHGIALLASEFFPRVGEDQGKIQSEKLGDYQYTRAAPENKGVTNQLRKAQDFLRPYLTSGVVVV